MIRRRIRSRVRVALAAALLGVAALPASSQAGVIFTSGNQQFTNVKITGDVNALTVVGTVDNSSPPVNVSFEGFNSSDTQTSATQILLHGSNGVAFVEPENPSDLMLSMTITAQPGASFTAMNFALDAEPPNDGTLVFTALDAANNPIALSSGTNTFVFKHNGQNNFTLTTDAGSLIHSLLIESVPTGSPAVTAPIADLKQVSVTVELPEPGSVVLLGGGAVLGSVYLVRRRKRLMAGA